MAMDSNQYRTLLFVASMLGTGIMCLVWNEREYEGAWLCLFADLGIICVCLFFLSKRLAATLRVLLSVLFYGAALVDIYCAYHFGSGLSPVILGLMLNTNLAEVSDFFSSYGRQLLYDWHLWLLLLVVALHITGAIWAGRWSAIQLQHKRKLALVMGGGLFVCVMLTGKSKIQLVQLLVQPTVSDMERLIFSRYDTSAYLPVYRLIYSCKAHSLAGREIEALLETTASVHVDSCSHRSPLIALVIGESYNRHHSSLYGYPLPTTPKQVERERKGELTVFTNVVSPWNITTNAFNHIFSLHHYGAEHAWSSYPLFPQLFRQAGYYVSFISNQFEQRGMSTFFNQTGGFFLNDNKLCDRQFDQRNRRVRHDDMAFLKECLPMLQTEERTFRLDIIHLHGQHFEYEDRYPSSEGVFRQRQYRGRGLSRSQRKTVAHYDNATLHNDNVLDTILQSYENSSAIVIYLSDHGEEVYDDLPVKGRLYGELTARQVRQEFEIPFWIWCSPSYREQHPDIVAMIKDAAQQPFITDRLPHLLFYLAGITSPDYDERLNLLSSKYDASVPRILEGIANYDALIKELR